jgi:hypothetical protein
MKSIIGCTAVIEYMGKCYLAKVIDKMAFSSRPKRMRISHDVHLQGVVVMPSQYTFKCWADEEDY